MIMKFNETIKITIDSETYKIISDEAVEKSVSISYIIEHMLNKMISEKKDKNVRKLHEKTA